MMYLFLACSGGESNDIEPKENPPDEVIIGKTYYQDVAPILSDNCLSWIGKSNTFFLKSQDKSRTAV